MRSGLARFRGSLTLLATLFVVMFVGAALTGGFYASADRPAPDRSEAAARAEAAAIARSGLELVLATADQVMLQGLVEGSDTILMQATVATLDGTRGSFTVRARTADARVFLAATAELEGAPTGRCTARMDWDLAGVRPPPPAAAAADCVADPGGSRDGH
ncbi:MAG: hypothetical protein WEB88_07720 [Gemmatimonadota bacterium]